MFPRLTLPPVARGAGADRAGVRRCPASPGTTSGSRTTRSASASCTRWHVRATGRAAHRRRALALRSAALPLGARSPSARRSAGDRVPQRGAPGERPVRSRFALSTSPRDRICGDACGRRCCSARLDRPDRARARGGARARGARRDVRRLAALPRRARSARCARAPPSARRSASLCSPRAGSRRPRSPSRCSPRISPAPHWRTRAGAPFLAAAARRRGARRGAAGRSRWRCARPTCWRVVALARSRAGRVGEPALFPRDRELVRLAGVAARAVGAWALRRHWREPRLFVPAVALRADCSPASCWRAAAGRQPDRAARAARAARRARARRSCAAARPARSTGSA